MSASHPLLSEIEVKLQWAGEGQGVRCAARRLAVLVTAVLLTQTTVVARLAARVVALGLTEASSAEGAARGLRRVLSDARLGGGQAYRRVLAATVEWQAYRRTHQPVVLIVDESSRGAHLHLLRVGLAYWGGSVPVAWALWEQNVPLPAGAYWGQLERVLAQARTVVPADLPVVVTADRAYDVPAFVDRVAAVGPGWHWVVRAKARGSVRYRTRQGQDIGLRQVVQRYLPRPGRRWKGRGALWKGAGWREASVVGMWAAHEREPVVVVTDLPARWEVLAHYDRRFWIECGFRSDKSHGWDWEESGVQGQEHHTVLVLALAWATLITMSTGSTEVATRLARLRARPALTPQHGGGWWGRMIEHARHSVFTLGLCSLPRWMAPHPPTALPWHLPTPTTRSWNDHWKQAQIIRNLNVPVRP